MIRVAAFTAGRAIPSARFRVRQYIPALAGHGITVREFTDPIGKDMLPPGVLAKNRMAQRTWLAARVASRAVPTLRSRFADLTWLNREMIRGLVTFEPYAGRPLVLDVDDAIWRSGDHVPRLARLADAVFAGNSYLAEWFSDYADTIHIIPTVIDTARFVPQPRPLDAAFTIGWTGSAANLGYLSQIEGALARFLTDHPLAHLTILCDQAPAFHAIPPDRVTFIRWTPGNEVTTLHGFDVGIMPLANGEWERGKCSFKMLQYMAVGLPAVVSPVGMNADIAAQGDVALTPRTEDEWVQALETLYDDPARRTSLGRAGRQLVEDHYSLEVVSERIAGIFRGLT